MNKKLQNIIFILLICLAIFFGIWVMMTMASCYTRKVSVDVEATPSIIPAISTPVVEVEVVLPTITPIPQNTPEPVLDTDDSVETFISKSSEAIREVIRNYEGFTPVATWDYAAYSYGYGHTSTDIKKGDTISKEAAIILFNEDIKAIDQAVVNFAAKHQLKLAQNEFDALVCFVYNFGQYSLVSFENKGYALISLLSTGDYTETQLIEEWTAYCHAGGKVLSGLLARRTYEVNLFLYGKY